MILKLMQKCKCTLLVAVAFMSTLMLNATKATTQPSTWGEADASGNYLVIDIAGGPNAATYPVSHLKGIPAGDWTDEYKKTKLVLRRIPAGDDPLGRYTLTKDFYAGIFEVTQQQWIQVMGSNPSNTKYGDTADCPVQCVSYNDIRGSNLGSQWPTNSEVDAWSFIGKLRLKTGIVTLDLPTDAQWEYACRAGTTTKYYLGDDIADLDVAGWYYDNSTNNTLHLWTPHPVGLKIPNAFNLYDMHGNVWEWCLASTMMDVDPIGEILEKHGEMYGRFLGGGCNRANACTSHGRDRNLQTFRRFDLGFRLFMTMP